MLKKIKLGGVSNLEVMPQNPRRGGSSGIRDGYFLISNKVSNLRLVVVFKEGWSVVR